MARGQVIERQNVRRAEIRDVYVVTHGRAVAGGVVVAVNFDVRQTAAGRAQNVGNQVRFRIVVFAAAFGGAGGVEVAQRGELQAVGPVAAFQNALHEELGP